jgi:uncharacterized protein YceK
MKPISQTIVLIAMLAMGGCANAQSTRNVSQGVSKVVEGSAQVIVGSVQTASTVVSAPVIVSGAAAAASQSAINKASEQRWGEEPLPVGEKTVVAGPSPVKAMENTEEER